MAEERQKELQNGLLLFEPRLLVGRIRTVRDIFDHRHVLKQAPFNVRTAEHLARLIHEALGSGQRFRVFDSIKVLRAVIVSNGGRRLPARTVRYLVGIYQHLIMMSREETQWCLSRLLKDQVLEDNAIDWLIDHWRESTHVVNRLLRYPTRQSKIIEWARGRYDADDLSDRRSELIAILLPDSAVDTFRREDPQVLGWAIMHSALSRSLKIQRLSSLAGDLSADALVTLAVRLNAPVIIHRALKFNMTASNGRVDTCNKLLAGRGVEIDC